MNGERMSHVLWLVGALSVAMGCADGDANPEGAREEEPTDILLSAESAAREPRVPVCDGGPKPKTKFVTEKQAAKLIDAGGYHGPCAVFGDKRTIGKQALETYAQFNADRSPWAIGVLMPGDFFAGLPGHEMEEGEGTPRTEHDGENCFDTNDNGKYDLDGTAMPENPFYHDECIGGFHGALDFPQKEDLGAFQWLLVNWNDHGHSPDGIYDRAHFDFHFYTIGYQERNFIRPGPCSLLINCDDLQRATLPLPDGFLHPDFRNLGAAEARMGNHMLDQTAPEWSGGQFSEAFLFGTWDAKVAFWEPMITLEYLETKPNVCKPIKVPTLYAESGWYPTTYCVRYRAARDEYTVSLESFVHHDAAPQ